MTLELGGIVNITCQKTGYSAILEFKLKVSADRRCHLIKEGLAINIEQRAQFSSLLKNKFKNTEFITGQPWQIQINRKTSFIDFN